ncbi:hypothetical protein C8J56DRAFT_1026697 [Mycena floridula]|nr:hypothetical protein C8J56DRAFT_1026697 [Mycena floridula]
MCHMAAFNLASRHKALSFCFWLAAMIRLSALPVMTSQLDTFPDIPDDIIRLIFEAAVQAERSAALNLVLLARHAQKWIQPLQFKAVRLRFDQDAEDFLQEVTSNPTRLGIHVQTMTLPSLRRMSVTVGYQSDPELTLHKDIIPFLPESMTHLQLHAYDAYPLFPDGGLKRLTRLTHFIVRHNCYENGTIRKFVKKLFRHLPDSLQQIIIAVTTDDPHFPAFRGTDDLCFAWVMEQCDPRVVLVMQPPKIKVHKSIYDCHWTGDRIRECILFDTLTPTGDWCSSPLGHTDIWDRAAEMQEKVARLRLTYREDGKTTSVASFTSQSPF